MVVELPKVVVELPVVVVVVDEWGTGVDVVVGGRVVVVVVDVDVVVVLTREALGTQTVVPLGPLT